MHALPLFHPTLCMPSPYSIPPHACLPPIPSHPVHALPLFHPTPCMPSSYSIPLHACPPILSQPMHTILLFYPAHACHLQLYPSPCTPSPYSLPAHTYMHALLTHCHITYTLMACFSFEICICHF